MRSLERHDRNPVQPASKPFFRVAIHTFIISSKPARAVAYLNAAIEEGVREIFLPALRNVAEANGGMGVVAAKANLSRESLYRKKGATPRSRAS